MIAAALMAAQQTTSWPEAFMVVGVIFGFAFMIWAITR